MLIVSRYCFLLIGLLFLLFFTTSSEAKVEPIVQLGHSNYIADVKIDSKCRYIVSGGYDNIIKVWSIENGKILRTIPGHSDFVYTVAIDPNDRYIISGSRDKTIKIWNFKTGKLFKTLKCDDDVKFAAMDSKGKYIISLEYGYTFRTLKIWNFKTGDILKTFKEKNLGRTISIDLQGRYIAYVFKGKNGYEYIKLRDIETGKIHRTFEENNSIKTVDAIAIDPQGRYVISGVSTSNSGNVKIWDIKTGKIIRVLSKSGTATAIAIDSTGKYIVENSNNKIKIWNYKSGKLLKNNIPYKSNFVIDPQARFLASINSNNSVSVKIAKNEIEIWSLRTGELLKKINSGLTGISDVTVDPKAKYIISGHRDGTIKIWDYKNPQLLKSFIGHNDSVTDVEIDPTGRYIVSAGSDDDKTIKIWSLKTAELLNSIRQTYHVKDLEIDSKGLYIVSIGNHPDRVIKIWDLNTAKLIKSIQMTSGAHDIEIDPKGQYIISADTKIRIWNLNTGKLFKTILGYTNYKQIIDIEIGPKGKCFYSSAGADGTDNTLEVWSLENWRHIRTIHANTDVAGDLVGKIAIDPKENYIISGDQLSDNNIRVWDINSGNLVKILIGHSSVGSVKSQSKNIISGGLDNILKIWNLETDNNISLAASDKDWVVYSDDGFFDASKNGGTLVPMIDDNLNMFGMDQFAIKNNRPDILLKRVGVGDSELITYYYNQYRRRLKKLGFTEKQLSGEFHVPEAKILETNKDGKFITIKYNFNDRKYNLKRYNIYVNDVPIFGASGKKIYGKIITKTEKLELTSGENKIEITCINENGAESFRALTYANYNQKVKNNLYYIGFGVSKYKDTSLNLSYADKDVTDLAEVFLKMKGKYENVYIKTFLNDQVTIGNIKVAKKFLNDSKVDDIFVLFIAGHGVHDKDKDATYYYLTHNSDIRNLSATAADFASIEDLLQGIEPRNKLFLMDTCESGEIDDGKQDYFFAMSKQRGFKARTTRNIKTILKKNRTYLFKRDRYIYNDLIRRSGTIVFSSSKGGEFSYESDKLRNGFFTEEILRALTDKNVDNNKDGIISINELQQYVIKSVSKLSHNMQHPTVDRDNIYQKFGFPIVR